MKWSHVCMCNHVCVFANNARAELCVCACLIIVVLSGFSRNSSLSPLLLSLSLIVSLFQMFNLYAVTSNSMCFCLSFSLSLSRSPCSLIIKVHWYIITVHIYLKSHLGEWEASPPLLWLCIIKCYYLHPVQLLSHPLIKSAALRKLTTSYANWKRKKTGLPRKHGQYVRVWDCV